MLLVHTPNIAKVLISHTANLKEKEREREKESEREKEREKKREIKRERES